MADKDQYKGKANEGFGAVKEKAGEFTGDRNMQAEGNAQKNEGKLQHAVGNVKDAAGDAVDAVKDKFGH